MSQNSFKISYPALHAGTNKSLIKFISGTPDLAALFFEGEEAQETRRRFFVTDATVASLECMQSFISKFDDGVCGKDCLLILGSGEPYKTIESVLNIVRAAFDANFTRKDIFIGIGGGVICDLTAFAASIYKRGTSVQFVPTTLLAMVDASIGGKTGCDFENYKNIIGTFFPATKLFYFPEFVQYLPENQYNSGLAEAFKTALLFDKELYDMFKNDADKINSRDSKTLEKIIHKCVKAKGSIVEQDFTEQGIRAYLNLGHTFGHALETVAGLGSITHGAAVAWGIGRAVELAYKKEYCMQAFRDEVFGILKAYKWYTESVPSFVKGGGFSERLITIMRTDKKNLSEKIRLIICKAVTEIQIEEVDEKLIASVLKA
ncbi:3-dehydroquinate synthase family protein [Treponema bryantii]|nr:3-dehydroquinate synthase [Treponema bryantii]